MKLAIMQPYLFPYLGYFQLIQAVDSFVIYDYVNFMKGGWINRNFIIAQGKPQRITLPLQGASPNKLINQVNIENNNVKILKSIKHSYTKAPQFATVFPLIEEVLMQQENNLALFIYKGLRQICEYLDQYPKWHISSELHKDNSLQGQDKVLSICEELGATHYINSSGGKSLYEQSSFEQQDIRLSFIEPRSVVYSHFGKEFVPNLSIIDVLMFNEKEQCSKLLKEYDLD